MSDNERLAALEVSMAETRALMNERHQQSQADRQEFREMLADEMTRMHTFQRTVLENMEREIKEIGKVASTMNAEITKYKGFLGGVTLVITALVTVLSFFKSWLFTKLGV